MDSLGGSFTACGSLYQEIQDIKHKVVVSFGNISACQWVYYIITLTNAERIFALLTTITGSIARSCNAEDGF